MYTGIILIVRKPHKYAAKFARLRVYNYVLKLQLPAKVLEHVQTRIMRRSTKPCLCLGLHLRLGCLGPLQRRRGHFFLGGAAVLEGAL